MSIEGAVLPIEGDTSFTLFSSKEVENLETTRVLFFAGNAVTPREQYEQPSIKGFGGICLPQIKTLGKHGMLFQCRLTALNTTMIPDYRMMIPPGERDGGKWQTSYSKSVVVNGVAKTQVIDGFMESDPNVKKGEFAQMRSDHIMSKKRYPGTDVRRAIQRSVPNGVGGVVEVLALRGATTPEIYAAQVYFFPDWDEITQAIKVLPRTIREIESQIKDRIAAIDDELEVKLRHQYRQIGSSMLQSCADYRRTGLDIIKKDEITMKKAFTDGETQATYSDISAVLLDMLEHKRKEDTITGESSSVDRLARIMEKKELNEVSVESQRFLLEERKQYTAEITAGLRERDMDEEIRLGLRKPVTSVEIPTAMNSQITELTLPETVIDVAPLSPPESVSTHRECGKPKLNGDPCERLIKVDQEACFRHMPETAT